MPIVRGWVIQESANPFCGDRPFKFLIGVSVCCEKIAPDGRCALMIYHLKRPASLLGKFGEEALDGVEPRTRGRREVESEARVPVKPLTHLRMLVGGVVVEDHVHELSGGHLGLDSIQEADELLMAMALHTSADNLAFEYVESSKQRGCAVALVVMGHRAGAALLHWQAG